MSDVQSFRGSRTGSKRKGKPKLTAKRIQSTARVQEMMLRALDLVVQGKSVKDVARDLGVSDERARQLIDQCLAERQADVNARKDQVRTITLARLDALIAGLWDKRSSPYVCRVLVDLEDRRAKLLGLDQAQETNVNVSVSVSDGDLLSRAAAYGIALGAMSHGPRLGEFGTAETLPALPPSRPEVIEAELSEPAPDPNPA